VWTTVVTNKDHLCCLAVRNILLDFYSSFQQSIMLRLSCNFDLNTSSDIIFREVYILSVMYYYTLHYSLLNKNIELCVYAKF